VAGSGEGSPWGDVRVKAEAKESGGCRSSSPFRFWACDCPAVLPRLGKLPDCEQVNKIPAQPKLINSVFFSSFFFSLPIFGAFFFQP